MGLQELGLWENSDDVFVVLADSGGVIAIFLLASHTCRLWAQINWTCGRILMVYSVYQRTVVV